MEQFENVRFRPTFVQPEIIREVWRREMIWLIESSSDYRKFLGIKE